MYINKHISKNCKVPPLKGWEFFWYVNWAQGNVKPTRWSNGSRLVNIDHRSVTWHMYQLGFILELRLLLWAQIFNLSHLWSTPSTNLKTQETYSLLWNSRLSITQLEQFEKLNMLMKIYWSIFLNSIHWCRCEGWNLTRWADSRRKGEACCAQTLERGPYGCA